MKKSIEERLQILEDDRAIRDLKARYLRCCDLKDADGVRNTLARNGAVIAYEGFPPFNNRDAFVDTFRQMACQPGIFDIHHGANGVIDFDGPDRATGQWSLYFHNINLTAKTVTQMGVEYHDIYTRENGRWWISETRTRQTSFLLHSVQADGGIKVVAMGDGPKNYGES